MNKTIYVYLVDISHLIYEIKLIVKLIYTGTYVHTYTFVLKPKCLVVIEILIQVFVPLI